MFVNTMTNVAVQIVLLQTRDCVGLLSIREIIKTSKTSTLIDNIEQNLTDIKIILTKLRKTGNKICRKFVKIRVITKLPNSEQSYKGKVKAHKYINRQNQSTT